MDIFKKIKSKFIHVSPNQLQFNDILDYEYIYLYAGDIPNTPEYDKKGIVGLSLNSSDYRTIQHDITQKYPLPDNIADCYQVEDVFEHIEYDLLVNMINEIYRILKPGGYFRLSIPDYRCQLLYDRSHKDKNGEIYFDPGGGGDYVDGKVINGGHLWFPKYEDIKRLIDKSNFKNYTFYHYYNEKGESITNKVDYSKGYIQRTPDHDNRVKSPYRAMSIVVDMYK